MKKQVLTTSLILISLILVSAAAIKTGIRTYDMGQDATVLLCLTGLGETLEALALGGLLMFKTIK